MRLSLSGLVLALGLCAHAGATDLRLYPSFAEVRDPVTLTASGGMAAHRLTFTREAWSLVQPGSLSFFGAPLVRIRTLPTDLDWLTTQQRHAVKVLRAGQPPLDGTLVRASDLLVRLVSGEFLNVRRDELAFTTPPPLDWLQGGVAARFEVAGQGQVSGEVSYRTQALSWAPRYELEAAGSQARLAALAEIRNVGGEAFDMRQVDLFAGEVRTFAVAGQTGAAQVAPAPPPLPTAGTGTLSVAARPVTSAGELRGLQRYTLAGGLKLDRGETLTVPFVQPKITGFTRYDSISTYFDPQGRQGRASRHYKFTPDAALPNGPLSVREEGVPVGAVLLPAAQAGRAVNLDLGADNDLRYERGVRRLSQEKDPAGKVLSTTYEVTYTLTSTKTRSTRVQVREQVYSRVLAVDGQAVQGTQVNVERRVDVPAGGQAKITFKLKVGVG